MLRVPSRRSLLLGGAGLLVATLAGWLAWRMLAIPYAEEALHKSTGYRAVIGSLYPGLTTWRARQVVLFGAPPFDSAPLARIAAMDIRLGGAGGGLWRPSAVYARGIQLTYLRAGAKDNLRGDGRRRSGLAAPGRGKRPLVVVARDVRVEAFLRLGADGGPSVSATLGPLSAELGSDGALSAEAGGARLERPGWGALLAGRVKLASHAGRRSFTAGEIRLMSPDARLVHGQLRGGGTSEAGMIRLWLSSASRTAAALSGWAELSDEGSRGALETSGLSLSGLGPWLGRAGVDTGEASVTGRVAVDREPGGPASVQLALRLSGLTFSHPRLDRLPWTGQSLELAGRATVWTNGSRFGLDEVRLEAIGLPLVIRGFAELGPSPRGRWRITTPPGAPVACAALLAAAPAPVRKALAGLVLEGTLGLRLALAYDASAWDQTELEVALAPLCRVEREPHALQALLTGTGGDPPAAPGKGLPLDDSHPDFVPLSAMPPVLPGAFLTTEDARFFSHAGFDLENIRRALAHDLQVRSFARGASTITQQLAKNLFLGPERTLARKLEEVVLAWRVHERLGKRRTLELYLNIVELGPGIRGVKRAAEVYFGKPVDALTPLEAAHLAALTPNPQGFARRFRDGRVDEGWLRKLYDLLSMMNRSGRLTRAELAAARKSRLSLRRI